MTNVPHLSFPLNSRYQCLIAPTLTLPCRLMADTCNELGVARGDRPPTKRFLVTCGSMGSFLITRRSSGVHNLIRPYVHVAPVPNTYILNLFSNSFISLRVNSVNSVQTETLTSLGLMGGLSTLSASSLSWFRRLDEGSAPTLGTPLPQGSTRVSDLNRIQCINQDSDTNPGPGTSEFSYSRKSTRLKSASPANRSFGKIRYQYL